MDGAADGAMGSSRDAVPVGSVDVEQPDSEQAGAPTERAALAWDRRTLAFWRSPTDQPWWTRPALLVLAVGAGVLYAWRAGAYLEIYYAAAVRSMAGSWHDFFFGAFDPSGTITLDKLPGAFWVQALSVRLFGLHTWAIVGPQVVEGVATVLVFFRVVRRLIGPRTALLAAAVLALAPATVALNRGNISDTAMVLLLVAAADAAVAAVQFGRWPSLLAAGLWVGLAFQAKMLEAWLVLPALWLVVLVAGRGDLRRRLVAVLALTAVAGVVSLSWMTVVTVVPASSRPYVDGSQHDSVYEQVFVYNGFGRVDQASPNQLLSKAIGLPIPPPPPPAWNRLLTGALGRATAWLMPAALLSLAVGLVLSRRRPREDPERLHYLLWGAWLVVLGGTFSLGSSLNSYYLAALSPPLAALTGAGARLAWQHRREPVAVVLSALGVFASALYAWWLLPAHGTGLPGWLAPVVLVVGILAVGLVAWAWRSAERWAAVVALGALLAAVLLTPAVASVSLVQQRLGPFDTPFQPEAVTAGVRALFAVSTGTAAVVPTLEAARRGAPFLMATETSALAAPFIFDTGQEVLPIGGYTGTIPSPTLASLQARIDQGQFHLVIQSSTATDPRLVWIAQHCLALPQPAGAGGRYHLYYCLAHPA